MTTTQELFPDLLNRKTTRICWGWRYPKEKAPQLEDVFDAEGIVMPGAHCLLVYGNETRNDILQRWAQLGVQWAHLSGGWSNPMTMEFNLMRDLPGNVPFADRTVGDIGEGLRSLWRPRLRFSYLEAWRQILVAKGISKNPQELAVMKIGELLDLGAPDFWQLYVALDQEKIIGQTTSSPFPATEYEHGFLVSELHPVCAEGRIAIPISNVTGSRALGTRLLNHFLVFLVNGEAAAIESYVSHALWVAEEAQRKGKKVPYQDFPVSEIRRYAAAFVETARTVREEIESIVAASSHITAIQYAVLVYVLDGLGIGIYKFPKAVPHCFIKFNKEDVWRLA